MPGMDGYEFLDLVSRSDPGVHVILMSGVYTLDSALEAIRRGASDFMPKPIDRSRLKKSLDDVAALYDQRRRSEEHTSELQSLTNLVCRLLLEKKKNINK